MLFIDDALEPVVHTGAPPRGLSLALGALVVGSVLTGLTVWGLTRPDPQLPARFVVPLSPGLNPVSGPILIGISPEGRTLVYSGPDQLYRRDVSQLEWTPIAGTEGAVDPMFSPDGRWLAFENAEGLKRMPAAGGPVSSIVDGVVRGASWGADDMVVYGRRNSGLFRVSASGGVPQPLTELAEGETLHQTPHVLPNGRGVLFTIRSGSEIRGTDQWAVVSLASGDRRILLGGARPIYVATGHVLFVRDEALWAVSFDADRLEVTGAPVPVLEGLRIDSNSGLGQVAVSADGTLLYLRGGDGEGHTLVWVDRRGREETLDLPPREYRWARVSPDGSRFAVAIADGALSDIWVSSVTRPTLSRIAVDPASDRFPLWTQDSARIVFSSDRDGHPAIFSTAADGTGAVERLVTVEAARFLSPESWSSDGQTLVFTYDDAGTIHIGTLQMEDGSERGWIPLVDRATSTGMVAVSPDGTWLAYESSDSTDRGDRGGGDWEVFVERFPELGGREVVSTEGGGWAPVWSPDGSELFYRRRSDGAMMVVPITGDQTITPGQPTVLFLQNYFANWSAAPRTFDLAPDGERFLMISEGAGAGDAEAPRLILVLNWHQELKRLVPVD